MRIEALYSPIYLQPYTGASPLFYHAENLTPCHILERNFADIRDEINAFLSANSPGAAQKPFRYFHEGWNTVMLLNYMLINDRHYAFFPRTIEVLSAIDGISLAYFSLLSPHTEIPPHSGDTNTTYRIHLGISVPNTDAGICGLNVGGQVQNWQEGKTLAFCDAYEHSAWNRSDQQRIVLIVDVIREEYRKKGFIVCADTLASLGISRLAGVFSFIRKFPFPLMWIFHKGMTFLFLIILFVNRMLYFKNFRHALRPALVRHI